MVAHATGEQVEESVVMDGAGVEDRTVTRHRPEGDDRGLGDASNRDRLHCVVVGAGGQLRAVAAYRGAPSAQAEAGGDMIEELFVRDARNPVLTASDWPVPVNAVFNPGAIRLDDETLLLVRVEERTGRSYLGVARSADGLGAWTIEPERSLHPDPEVEAERFGIEDPRITTVDDEHLIAYTGYSPSGPLVCLAATRDFRSYERRGVLLPPENKDAALFPARFAGRYALLHRPVTPTHALPATSGCRRARTCATGATTPAPPRRRSRLLGLGEGRAGPAAAPDRGGLAARLPRGASDRRRGDLPGGPRPARPGAPERLLARSPDWVLGPTAPYERVGDVGNVVFPCGWVLLDDAETLRLYYGAADTSVCVATASLSTLLGHLGRAQG